MSDNKKIKIARIIARLNVGGPARHVVWLTKELEDNDFQTTLITGTVPEGEENMEYFAFENKVKPLFIKEMSRELSVKDIKSLWKIYRELIKINPDIIHTHTAKAGTVGRIAGLIYSWTHWKKVKIIHTFHGHVFHSYYGNLKTKIFLFIEKFLAYFATDKIIVISQRQKEEINKTFSVGNEKQFAVIQLGIDLNIFDNPEEKRKKFREEIGASDKDLVVGIVGRLTEIKNHKLFLNAIKLLEEAGNSNSEKIKFVVIGDGHLREELEKEAEQLKIKKKINFLGNRDDADVFYAGLDVVALTSLNEGTPLTLIEAMASKKPVISTEVGGVKDLLGERVENKETFSIYERGLSIKTEDDKGLSDGIFYLFENEYLRKELGKKGKEFVSKNYSKTRLVSDIRNLYKDLTKS